MTGAVAGTVTGPGAVAALQAALAAENAAVYGCGVAGAHLSGGQLNTIIQAWNAHRARRDQLQAMLRARGAKPEAALPSYRLPQPVAGPRDAVSLALLIEDRVTTAYLGLVALPDATLRGYGALAMQEAAVRAAVWRGGTTAFPGLPANVISSPRARKAVTAAGTTAAAWAATAAAVAPARHQVRANGKQTADQSGNQGGRQPAGHAGFIPAGQPPANGKGKHRGKGAPPGKTS